MVQNECTGYRFDIYELNLSSATLLRKGHRVRIQQLPFQMLVVLLEHSGRPVSHEELRKRLWKDQTYLDFENNLRVAVAKLREALGDRADRPRFIRTVARRGYEFAGDVTPVFEELAVALSAARVSVVEEIPITGSAAAMDAAAPPARQERRSYRVNLLWGALAVGVTAIVLGSLYRQSERLINKENGKITLGGIANGTLDPAYEGSLSTAFRFKMQESPYLNLVPEQDFGRIVGTSKAPATRSDQLAACRNAEAVLFLDGRIVSSGPALQLDINAWSCKDGRQLATVASSAPSQADVLPALDQATREMRRRLGEPESSLLKYTAPLAQATTSSLLALSSLAVGDEKVAHGQFVSAISDYTMAIDLDSQFALAYARLGTAYANVKQYSAARAAFQKAFELRERTTDRERLYIAAHYYATVTGELPREIEAYDLWQKVYPRDVLPVQNLVNIYLTLGQADEALTLANTAVNIAPFSPGVRALQARAFLGNGRYAELNQLCSDPALYKMDLFLFHTTCYLSAFAQRNQSAAQRELMWARGKPQESVMLEYQAWGAIYEGHIAAARQIFDSARQSAIQNHLVDFAAELDLDEATMDADLGLATEARTYALDALKIAPDAPSVRAAVALALARIGDVADAEDEATRAQKESIPNTSRSATLIAYTHAALLLDRHDPKGAIQLMEGVGSFENASYMALSPAYYRGLALLEDKRPDEAAKAFQKVIDHAKLYPESLYSELAYLQLGRTLQVSGNSPSAQRNYRILDVLWKNADANFPPLKELHVYESSTR